MLQEATRTHRAHQRCLLGIVTRSHRVVRGVGSPSRDAIAVAALGSESAARHFVAITDPGTALAGRAVKRRYRHCFLNPPDVGGRYSALSLFGLVPGALIGIDPARLLQSAATVPQDEFVRLGVAIGEATRRGRDKLTIITDRKSTRLNSSHSQQSRMPSSA